MIEKKLYSDQIIEVIKDDLLRGALKPGDRIKEAQLAERLGISRAPVCEALSLLEREGLVVSAPQKGKSIAALTPREILDSFTSGGVLEGWGVASTCHLFTEDDFRGMEELLHHFGGQPDHVSAWMAADSRFHDCLLAYVDNEVLIRTIHFLTRRISKFLILPHWLHAYSLDEARARHADLLETIKTRRPEAVRAAILEHYRQLGLKIVSRMS